MPNPTVSLDNDFTVYADVDTADVYMDGAFHGSAWRASDDDTKARALVDATRLLDRQQWKAGYDTYALRLATPNIVNASIEIALDLINGSDLQDAPIQVETNRSLRAGSVEIVNFRAPYAVNGIDVPRRFPQIVQELLAPYLAG